MLMQNPVMLPELLETLQTYPGHKPIRVTKLSRSQSYPVTNLSRSQTYQGHKAIRVTKLSRHKAVDYSPIR